MKHLRKLALAAVCMLGIGFFAFRTDERFFEIARNLDIYATLFKELNRYYVDEINPNRLTKMSIESMLKNLDPYTNFYAEDEIEDYRTMTTGQYTGIGAIITTNKGKNIVYSILEGSPAEKAGIHIGDEIVKIDGVDLTTRKDANPDKLMKGQANSTVKLAVRRVGSPSLIEMSVTREFVKTGNVPYYGMLTDEVGYIDLKDFNQTAAREVKTALVELKGKGMKKLVLDVRENPGGLLDQAVLICNLFIPKDAEVVSNKGKVTEWNKTYTAPMAPVDTEIPLVVLVNGRSASASEIVSGVIQDYDRGVLIGQRTYGKGLVQTTRDLSYNTKLKVTVAKYYIPSGRCIQAIDYSHRNADGSVGKIPDSLKVAFKTRNGRTVYDGGGVEPDVPTDLVSRTPIVNSLNSKGLFFDYALKYRADHPAIKPAKDFELSDADYQGFVNWLKDKEYDYTTQVEKDLSELEASARKEKYFDAIQEQFKALKTKLTHSKDTDLVLFKKDIKQVLEREIVSHVYLQKGEREFVFRTDPEVKAALDLFKDMPRYEKILKGTK
ncbi:S41 family peptidase [Runella slithyformis]|uniref:Carboxyl-terminal protease n=1 Tax=Runella slithyformis (strain ATCC 29530 / DSM 19594 / LMG 11500 / NCIMB 11436 / LSU 4) TaxID=761193 RepID=A0A7U3ZH61_RUNSL|nr:S41 family peptidase [Runella slithyformis]AEI47161.1 carboxyl-terminal protease [Runella slithyformis DSM 19594]